MIGECELDGFEAAGESQVWPGVMTCTECELLLRRHRDERTTAVIA